MRFACLAVSFIGSKLNMTLAAHCLIGQVVTIKRHQHISHETKKTNPNVLLFGADENYAVLNGFKIIATQITMEWYL